MELKSPISTIDHLRFFCETVGPRPLASNPFHEAADYVRRHFLNANLLVDEIQFDCVKWTHNESILTLNGDGLPVSGNMYSPACDVNAPTIALFTLAELEKADITGKIVIFAGNLSATPLIPLNCKVYNADRDQQINRQLIEKQPAAIIAVNPNPPSMESIIHDADLMVPSATVPAEVGLRLIDHLGRDIRLKIDAEREPGRSTTIMGKKKGPHSKRITLMAHFDSTVNSPGAWDNASGMAALLSLVDILTNLDLEVGLEFIAFGDHEYYAYSDVFYVNKHGNQMKDILVAINFDGIGQRLGSNNIALMTASEPFQQQVGREVAKYPGVVRTEPWPESNHSTFAWRGVPSIAFCTDGMRDFHHQPTDTIKWMSEVKIDEVVSLAEDIVNSIHCETVSWSRQPATEQD